MKRLGDHGKNRRKSAGKPEPPAEVLTRVRAILRECSERVGQIVRSCEGKANCCRFRLTGEVPHVTIGEAWIVWKGWRAAGRVRIEPSPDGSCPFLNARTNLCMIYECRPLACRTHFCVSAGGVVSRRIIADLIQELDDIDARCGGDGAVRLPDIEGHLARR